MFPTKEITEKFMILSGQLNELIEYQKDAVSLLNGIDKRVAELQGQIVKELEYMNKTVDIIGAKVNPAAYEPVKKAPQPPAEPTTKEPKKPREPPHEPTEKELEEERIRRQILAESEEDVDGT